MTPDDAISVLIEVQWNGYAYVGLEPCPLCGGERPKHDDDCGLDELLRALGRHDLRIVAP